MVGKNGYINMSNSEERIKSIWEEIIVKEKLNIILMKIEEENLKNKQNTKDELTELWNNSEIPIFKNILAKLVTINNHLETRSHIKDETDKEIKPIHVLGRSKAPILMDISKSKPKLTTGVKRGIDSLAELHKLGKF